MIRAYIKVAINEEGFGDEAFVSVSEANEADKEVTKLQEEVAQLMLFLTQKAGCLPARYSQECSRSSSRTSMASRMFSLDGEDGEGEEEEDDVPTHLSTCCKPWPAR